jgi:hypothetical protein
MGGYTSKCEKKSKSLHPRVHPGGVKHSKCWRNVHRVHRSFAEVFTIRAGILKDSTGARNQGGIGLSYRPSWLRRLAELIPWNRFLGSKKL